MKLTPEFIKFNNGSTVTISDDSGSLMFANEDEEMVLIEEGDVQDLAKVINHFIKHNEFAEPMYYVTPSTPGDFCVRKKEKHPPGYKDIASFPAHNKKEAYHYAEYLNKKHFGEY